MPEKDSAKSSIPGKTSGDTIKKVRAERAKARGKKQRAADDKNPMTTSQVYMRSILDYSLLTREEENQLADEIHAQDQGLSEEACARLIQSNLRLVVKIANDFANKGLPKHDLISEGNIGLMNAAQKFDPTKGAKFSTYSTWWIKQAMRRALAEQSRTIRVPIQSVEKISKIKATQKRLTEELGRQPSDEEIAMVLDFSKRTVAELRHASLTTSSLNEPIVDGEQGEVGDFIADNEKNTPDQMLGDFESVDRLQTLVENLRDREKQVLTMRFGLNGSPQMTLEEVGESLGCTRERVRQIQNKAIRKLKQMHLGESG